MYEKESQQHVHSMRRKKWRGHIQLMEETDCVIDVMCVQMLHHPCLKRSGNVCMYRRKWTTIYDAFSRPRNMWIHVCSLLYIITLAFECNNIIVHSRWMDLISVVRRHSHELYTLCLIIVHMYPTLSKYIFPERIILLYFPSKTLILSKSNGRYSLLSLCGNIKKNNNNKCEIITRGFPENIQGQSI